MACSVPRSVAEVDAYYEAILPKLAAGPQARSAVRFLLWPPVPSRIRPAYAVLAAAAVSTLPTPVRRELWLPESPMLDDALVKPAGELCAGLIGWALGSSPVVAAAQRRASSSE